MTAYEILKIYKRNSSSVILIIIQIICCLFLLTVLFSNSVLLSQRTAQYADIFSNKEYYLLTDLDGETNEFQEYMDSEDGFDKLNNFVTELRRNKSFDFISTVNQPIWLEKSISDDTRFSYYENTDWNGDDINLTLKCVQLSSNVFNIFNLKINDGEAFSESDYSVYMGKEVPVLLGSAYKDFVETGYKFRGDFIGIDFDFVVKGFLDKGSIIISKGAQISLDYYIIIPAFVNFGNTGDHFKKFNLSQQANGAIISQRKELNLTQYIDKLITQTKTMKFEVSPIVSDNSEELKALSKDMADEWIFLSMAVSAFLLITVHITLTDCVKSNFKVFAVHCCCGAGIYDIKKIINHFILSLFAVSTVGAFILIKLFQETGALFFSSLVPVISILLFILNKTLIAKKFNKYSISDLIKE